eukprot:scaffold70712_cov31-Tisochrysis_lutea.AAC.2
MLNKGEKFSQRPPALRRLAHRGCPAGRRGPRFTCRPEGIWSLPDVCVQRARRSVKAAEMWRVPLRGRWAPRGLWASGPSPDGGFERLTLRSTRACWLNV